MKQVFDTLKSKTERKIFIVWIAICRLMFPLHVSANALQQSSLFRGVQNLIRDAITVLTLLTAGTVAFFFIKNMYKVVTGEEDEKPAAKKNAKNTLVIGVLIICAEVLVNLIFGYFTAG